MYDGFQFFCVGSCGNGGCLLYFFMQEHFFMLVDFFMKKELHILRISRKIKIAK